MSQATISGLPSPSRSKKRTFATTGTPAPGAVEGLLLEAQAAVARRPRRRQRQRHRRAGLEVADELRRVHLPQDALLAGRDARAHEAALGHLLDAQAPHAAGQVLRLGHDVALRALLLHGLDERRVGQRVGLAVEAEDRAAGRRRRRRRRRPLGRGGHGLGRRALPCGGLDGAECGDERKSQEEDRGVARTHGHPVYIAARGHPRIAPPRRYNRPRRGLARAGTFLTCPACCRSLSSCSPVPALPARRRPRRRPRPCRPSRPRHPPRARGDARRARCASSSRATSPARRPRTSASSPSVSRTPRCARTSARPTRPSAATTTPSTSTGRALARDEGNVAIRRNLALAYYKTGPDGGRGTRGGGRGARAARERRRAPAPRRLPLPPGPERPRRRAAAAPGWPHARRTGRSRTSSAWRS